MRLQNVEPTQLVGRTIVDHLYQYWRVDAVSKDGSYLELSKPARQQTGRLRRQMLGRCRVYPTAAELQTRYPRIIRSLRWACILTQSEAECALTGYLTTGSSFMGSEAVAHVGGALAAIRHAIRCRHAARRSGM